MQKKIVKYFRLLLAFRCMKEENNEVTIEKAEEKSEMDMSRTYVLHYER